MSHYGYGLVKSEGQWVMAHRIAWARFNGRDPAGMVVRHTCDNRACVNPEHLVIGTQADNVRDMVVRGRCWTKVTDEQVVTIRAMVAAGATRAEAARLFGISPRHAGRIVSHINRKPVVG